MEVLNKKTAVPGAFPTMITPYTEKGTVDFEAIDALTEWYWKNGCAGIFASCQSSEIHFMEEDERVAIADRTKKAADALAKADKSRAPMTVIASGHVSDSFEAQVRELTRIAETGADGVIWITNRLDIANTGDDAWLIDNFEKYPEMAEKVAANLSIAAFTECMAYPITAKYHLSAIENIPMTLLARSRKAEAFSDYDVLCVRQMDLCMRQLMDEVEKL